MRKQARLSSSRKLIRMALLGGIVASLGLLPPVAAQEQVSATPITGGLATNLKTGHAIHSRTILLRPKLAKTKLTSRFFPSAEQVKKGNAAPIFLRMNWEANSRIKALNELRATDLMETTIEKLDTEKIDNLWVINLGEMTRAVYRERAGWEYPLDEVPLVSVLLPDVQESRNYVHALVLKGRSHIKKGEIVDAEKMFCLAIGLSKHIGETPFVVNQVVRRAQTDLALRGVEELMQHPSADNYYWDLTSLPRPMIDTRTCIQLESAMVEKSVLQLQDIEQLKTEEEWQEVARLIASQLSDFGAQSDLPKLGTPEAEKLQKEWVKLSRERLPKIAPDLSDRIDKMSDAEVGVRYWYLRVQQRIKSSFALAHLEPHEAISQLEADLDRLETDMGDEVLLKPIGVGFLHSLIISAAKLDQRVAMLRTIEAIRHQSELDGRKLPKTLEGLALVVPTDPFSGKPFEYTCSSDQKSARLQASLTSLRRRGEVGDATVEYQEIYELKIVD